MDFEKQSVLNRLINSGEYETYYTQADETEREAFRTWVKGLLWERPVLIEFVKADGNTRVMNCTLNSLFGAVYADREVTESTETAQREPRKPNQHVCVVWDIDQAAWRSFRWDRLRKIEFKVA